MQNIFLVFGFVKRVSDLFSKHQIWKELILNTFKDTFTFKASKFHTL